MVVAAVCASLAAGCATDPRTGQPSFKETFASDDPCSNNARNIGITLGAIAGLVLANQVKHSDGARLLGAAAGAAIGGLIGRDMDQRRCELSKIARQYDLTLQTATVTADGAVIEDRQLGSGTQAKEIRRTAVGMVVGIVDKGGHFESNSDRLTEKAQQYFSAIADSYNGRIAAAHISDPGQRAEYSAQIAKRRILLIGHTDDTGNSRLNADLAERRARAVAAYMEKRGIPRASLYYQGAGEAYPVADNNTDEGRAQNRRVEIVEVAGEAAFERFLAERKPRYEFYRQSQVAEVTVAPAVPPPTAAPQPARPAARIQGTKKAAAAATGNKSTVAESRPVETDGVDFGGKPYVANAPLADIGQLSAPPARGFQLISSAFASEPPLLSDCTRDRPRVAHGVKTLADGKAYRTSEYMPGLYGKTWTEKINGHQVVVNRIAVLASNGSAGNLPEFKVYANYDPTRNANPSPALSISPEVNTYLGNKGVLYRMFLQGKGGLACADIVFTHDGGNAARDGRLVYSRAARLMSTDFKPKMYQK
jgi:outer membrane protein OmpA-like peptidoglycan-associated protein